MLGLDVHLAHEQPQRTFEETLEKAGIERLAQMVDSNVLAPRKGHTYHRGNLHPTPQGIQPPSKNWVVIEYEDTGSTVFCPPARVIPWHGYAERVVGQAIAAKKVRSLHVSVWRCELWTEGLFSCLFFALGFLQAEVEAGAASGLNVAPDRMLIDWTSELILCHGGRQSDNAWNHFFEQPPPPKPPKKGAQQAAAVSAAEVEAAAEAGTLAVTARFGAPWFDKLGRFRGAEPVEGGAADGAGGGRLDEATLREGRAAFKRWLRVRPAIQARVDATVRAVLRDGRAQRWLAVHVRQTDKLQLASPGKWVLDAASVASHAAATATALRCDGVFIASDDAA